MDEQDSEHVEEVGLEPVAVVRRRQPRVLWAVLAVIAVAAGALVVTATDGDGGSHPGLPVDLGAASRASGTAAAADASMAAWVHYVAGDALPALGGEGTAYRMSGEVDEAKVRRLADALGLDGAVESDGAGSWWVAGGGGRGRLDVFAGGGAALELLRGRRGLRRRGRRHRRVLRSGRGLQDLLVHRRRDRLRRDGQRARRLWLLVGSGELGRAVRPGP